MDDILEENLPNHALEKQKEMVRKYRNCGIGIMGLHDAFIKMGIVYGSASSINTTHELMNFIFNIALSASVELGKERGNFPGYSPKVWDSTIIKENVSQDNINKYRKFNTLRNCSLLSIAPCGSISTMLNVSSGIEPWFALHYTRNTKSLEKDKETSFEVWAPIAKQANDLKWCPKCLVTSNDISWKQHIDIQAVAQRAVDTAISKTINMPKETTLEDVKQLYVYAWKSGLKGCTIYVNGSRDPILTTDSKTSPEEPTITFNAITPISRKKLGVTSGSTYCKKCSCGTLYITCNKDQNGNLIEIFTHTSKGGICQANLNAETRMASLALRSGVKVDEVVDQLKGISCPACIAIKAKGGKVDGISCADIIAKTIQEFQNTNVVSCCDTKPIQETKPEKIEYEECPECHEKTLIHSTGCVSCPSCGYSRCN